MIKISDLKSETPTTHAALCTRIEMSDDKDCESVDQKAYSEYKISLLCSLSRGKDAGFVAAREGLDG